MSDDRYDATEYVPKHHPGVAHVLRFFAYEHLPHPLRGVSQPFHTLANELADTLPSNPETTVALRKLLESKDCAVRAELCRGSQP